MHCYCTLVFLPDGTVCTYRTVIPTLILPRIPTDRIYDYFCLCFYYNYCNLLLPRANCGPHHDMAWHRHGPASRRIPKSQSVSTRHHLIQSLVGLPKMMAPPLTHCMVQYARQDSLGMHGSMGTHTDHGGPGPGPGPGVYAARGRGQGLDDAIRCVLR